MISDEALKLRNQRKIMMQSRKSADNDCLLWCGQISNGGYGQILLKTSDGNKMHSAHRASYELFNGPIEKNKIITQSCKNRLCVNPKHLTPVDQVPVDHWHHA